jgi:enoyl-CoA hydratase/carnithine racemase
MSASLKSHSQGQTLVLTISDPERHNALDTSVCAAAVEALGVAESSAEVRSVVITGDGAHFCAGLNLRVLQTDRPLGAEHNLQQIESIHSWIEAIRTFPKPVIAAVEGTCAATGFSLALACDMLVAAHNSVFVMSHSGVGLSPDGGATHHLLAALPRAAATHLLMTGERISAERLHQWGVVTQLSNPDEALADALLLCQRLNARAPLALGIIKELIHDAPSHSLNAQLRMEREHWVRNLMHPHAQEGLNAFLDKRPAHYR